MVFSMDCSTNQCCAVSHYNSKCFGTVVPGSDHCEIHRPKAFKLYLAYKRLSDIIDTLDFNKYFNNIMDRIKYVMKCYNLLNKTFDARIKHRKYAYVPECYDIGHDYQFVKLKNQIEICENILAELYTESSCVNKFQESSEESEDDGFQEDEFQEESSDELRQENVKTFPKRISKYIRHRKKIELEIDEWINKYIKENEEILRRRTVLVDNIMKLSLELFNPYDLDNAMEFAFAKCVMIYNLTHKLFLMGYLPKNDKGHSIRTFVPTKCKCCDQYEVVDLQLSCRCIFENNTILKYLSLPSIDTLKQFFGLLLYNKDTIAEIVEDIKSLYEEYKDHTMFLRLYLVWNPLTSKLTIQQNFNHQRMKHSKIMAISRKKKHARSISHLELMNN